MSSLDDAIARAQASRAAANQYEGGKTEQLTWARAESLALTRRFVESLRAAGYQPLRAKRLRLTYSPRQVKVGSWPSRRTRSECAWTQATEAVGEAWPVLKQQWVTQIPSMGGDNTLSRPGRDVFAGIVYLPAADRLAEAVFDGLTWQRKEAYESIDLRAQPTFAALLAQREVTLRHSDVVGEGNGCSTCQEAVPAWHSGGDWAQLPIGPQRYVEDLPGGGTRDVYPDPGLVSPDQRHDVLLGPAIERLTGNLGSIGVSWAPPGGH